MRHPVVKIDRDGKHDNVNIDNCKPVYRLNPTGEENNENDDNNDIVDIPEIVVPIAPKRRIPPASKLRNRNIQYTDAYDE